MSEMRKECEFRAADVEVVENVRSTDLAVRLDQLWHSLPLVGVLSSGGDLHQGRKHCARKTWWYLVHTPNSYCHSCVDVDVNPCSFLAMSKAIGSDSGSDLMASRRCSEVRRIAHRKDRLWLCWLDKGGR